MPEGHPQCDMPYCNGNPSHNTHAVRDPSDKLLEMCDGCLSSGWKSVVEVVE